MLKISKKLKNLYILSVSFILLVILIVSYFFNPADMYKKEKKNDFVFSPVYNDFQNNNQSNYFELLNNLNINYIEKMIYNWQIFFDIFAFNPQLKVFKSSINTSVLESLSDKLKEPQKEFFKGSSDEILKEFGDVLKAECNYYKLDYRLVLAIMKQESSFTSDAISRAGAYGFMQIMPGTGSSLENTLELEDYKSPKNNLIAGIYYYALLVGRYDGVGEDKYKFALAAYNAGSGRVEDAMTIIYYLNEDFKKWDKVREGMKMLGKDNDSLHQQIWHSHPPNGYFSNWKEPINYVDNVIYYWNEYKRIYKKQKL